MNNNMSYAEMYQAAMNQTKKEIDQYFDKKVKEFEDRVVPKARQPYVDPYPEEAYRGLANPMNRLIFSTTDATHILYNRKLGEYRAGWKLKDRMFMDSKHTLPVSEGWIIECSRYDDYPELTATNSERSRAQQMSHKEYHAIYIENKNKVDVMSDRYKEASWLGLFKK